MLTAPQQGSGTAWGFVRVWWSDSTYHLPPSSVESLSAPQKGTGFYPSKEVEVYNPTLTVPQLKHTLWSSDFCTTPKHFGWVTW